MSKITLEHAYRLQARAQQAYKAMCEAADMGDRSRAERLAHLWARCADRIGDFKRHRQQEQDRKTRA